MKSTATARNKKPRPAANPHSLAAVKYQKVYDGRKRRVRGLWKRGDTFYAQLSLPDADGNRRVRRVPLEANTTASAADELRRMMIKRNDNQLPAMVQNPRFDHFAQEYLEREYALGRKTLKTLGTESGHINFWTSVIGETRLNRITPKMIQGGLIRRKGTGVSPRTLNICLTVLRNVLRGALQEGWLLDSPARTVQWQKVPTKKRPLFSSQQLESMYTDYNLEVLDMSMTDGNQVNFGTYVDPGTARLLKRKYNGDSNGNDRLDIGDGTLVQRLLTGFDEKRSWDSGGNDLNGNGKLDSGDVILLLRTVVGLDKQPSSGNRDIAKMTPRPVIRMGGPDDEPVEMASIRLVEKKGGRIKVQVLSENLESAMSGIAFTLHYPVDKLRLKDQKAHSVGEIVPDDAVRIWNVFPGQNDYLKQTGKVRLALSNVEQWELANGVLAEFELEVEGGAKLDKAELSLSEVELTPTGYDNRMLPDVVLGLGEESKPPVIVEVSGQLPFGFSFDSQKGKGYVVEASDDLRKWNPVETIQGAGSVVKFTDRREAIFERQYYRVRVD